MPAFKRAWSSGKGRLRGNPPHSSIRRIGRAGRLLSGARFEEAQRRGAAMAVHKTVDYAQEQIRQALAESDRAGR
jgi:hypothetical protein